MLVELFKKTRRSVGREETWKNIPADICWITKGIKEGHELCRASEREIQGATGQPAPAPATCKRKNKRDSVLLRL